MSEFKVYSKYNITNPQEEAVNDILDNFKHQTDNTLLGVTGSGKTFMMSKVIEKLQRPTLVITHNKTLVAQLYEEFNNYFPDNKVEYYVSHFDYYRPESYLPVTDTYISKETMINDELERLKVKTVSSLTEGRDDVVVVASISAIFGAGNPDFFKNNSIYINVGDVISRNKFLQNLVTSLYSRTEMNRLERGTFVVKGDTIFIRMSQIKQTYKIVFFGDEIEEIHLLDDDLKSIDKQKSLRIIPKSIFVMDNHTEDVYEQILSDLDKQVKYFRSVGKEIEATRLEERTKKDVEFMRELGYCDGMENYSNYFDGRMDGQRTSCLLDYFPEDFLIILDESHVTLPQLKAMYKGALSTKQNLVDYGFRLPSALNNRPLKYTEFESITDKVLYVSATPSEFELSLCSGLFTEICIRPTNILDPEIIVKPTQYCVDHAIEEIQQAIEKDQRVLCTTISKRQAEDLAKHLQKHNINACYLHGDIETLDRIEILYKLRSGEIDVIVGINLLREGLDLPEVSKVLIFDADKEGFLRNYASMMQVIGRAARNIHGKAILYADKITKSMQAVIDKNIQNRTCQINYNTENNLKPVQIVKAIDRKTVSKKLNNKKQGIVKIDKKLLDLNITFEEAKQKMEECSKNLDFINAIKYRDLMKSLK